MTTTEYNFLFLKGQFHGNGSKLHEGTKLHEDKFARGDKIARRQFCTEG